MKMLKSSKIVEIVDPTAIRRKAVSCKLSDKSQCHAGKSMNEQISDVDKSIRILELIKWKSVGMKIISLAREIDSSLPKRNETERNREKKSL